MVGDEHDSSMAQQISKRANSPARNSALKPVPPDDDWITVPPDDEWTMVPPDDSQDIPIRDKIRLDESLGTPHHEALPDTPIYDEGHTLTDETNDAEKMPRAVNDDHVERKPPIRDILNSIQVGLQSPEWSQALMKTKSPLLQLLTVWSVTGKERSCEGKRKEDDESSVD
ncbi:hypothetical protein G7054_g6109 [Neopestalotiopsis clavispora]|nr:hypothetical protein G7054_g6109 [Neopestalotiopsis clavispora]